ncbi:MAG: sulfite reductase flavoprotein subunit alpha [Rhodanobacter sp.]
MTRVSPSWASSKTLDKTVGLGGFVVLAWMTWSWRVMEWGAYGVSWWRWMVVLLVAAGWLALVVRARLRRAAFVAPDSLAQSDMSAGDLSVAVTITEPAVKTVASVDTAILVAYASQTGFAEQLARQTFESLGSAGVPARLEPLGELTLNDLASAGRVLFVTSTTGDGDPPDDALSFASHVMASPALLTNLHYGLLALGDRDYEDFCGFGRQLRQWLQTSGAQPLFDPVEVDSEDEASLRHWQHQLASVSGATQLPDWQPPRYQRWKLMERRLLNPESLGGPCFHVALQPPLGGDRWQAGDLVEVGPAHAADAVAHWLADRGLDGSVVVKVGKLRQPLSDALAGCHLPTHEQGRGLDEAALAATLQMLPHREYSIASIPSDGAIHLLVRQTQAGEGSLGMGSGWLTSYAALGAEVALRVRNNVNFHVPANDRPLILLGNGTGMAALHALLRARVAANCRRNWLLFGERQQACDFYYHDEIQRWCLDGYIERTDFAWSRDQPERIYVQQRLREAADELRRWIDAGAAIYVCGSLAGMAPAVDAVLNDVLGAESLEQLRQQGRYRRDVY